MKILTPKEGYKLTCDYENFLTKVYTADDDPTVYYEITIEEADKIEKELLDKHELKNR